MYRLLAFAILLCLWACSSSARPPQEEQEGRTAAGWTDLLDGGDLRQWQMYSGQPLQGWEVVDGELRASGAGWDANQDLITKKTYDNFELDLEWKVAPANSSGIFYFVQQDPEKPIYESAPEYQVMDDAGWPDPLEPNQLTAGNYAMHAAEGGTLKPAGEWNSARIVVRYPRVEHWLNGKKVVDYELGSADWQARKAAGKWAEVADYGKATSGYIGLQNAGEVVYRKLRIRELPATVNNTVRSILEVYDLDTDERTEVYAEERHFEAPNWTPDGQALLINQAGRLYTVGLDGKKAAFDTGGAERCNNDHGYSPDGRLLAFSNNLEGGEEGWLTSCIFTVPAAGGTPQRVTERVPSFWHGWSPGSDTLVYTARRDGHFNLFAVAAAGGAEVQLTDTEALDDGPEYAPDGRHIYFNSARSGSMEIWRMRPDGSQPEQLTDDDYSNWFAHPTPDGRYFVFITYLEDQGEAHPPMKDVALRLYDTTDGSIRTLCAFTGGQGSLNVPSWSPDGRRFAFVSYAYR